MQTNTVKEIITDARDVKIMTDEELSLEVAYLCGLSGEEATKVQYAKDLNAMHLAEEKVIISWDLQQEYFDFLDIVIPIPKKELTESVLWVMVHANARCRAEALVLTKKFKRIQKSLNGLIYG